VAQIPEIVDKRVADKVDTLFIEKMTAIMPRLFEAFGNWDAAGRVGPPPIPSIIGSNSSVAALNILVTPAAYTAAAPHVTNTAVVVGITSGVCQGQRCLSAGVPGVSTGSSREDRLWLKGRLRQQLADDSTEESQSRAMKTRFLQRLYRRKWPGPDKIDRGK
jgi:hypothetical protein